MSNLEDFFSGGSSGESLYPIFKSKGLWSLGTARPSNINPRGFSNNGDYFQFGYSPASGSSTIQYRDNTQTLVWSQAVSGITNNGGGAIGTYLLTVMYDDVDNLLYGLCALDNGTIQFFSINSSQTIDDSMANVTNNWSATADEQTIFADDTTFGGNIIRSAMGTGTFRCVFSNTADANTRILNLDSSGAFSSESTYSSRFGGFFHFDPDNDLYISYRIRSSGDFQDGFLDFMFNQEDEWVILQGTDNPLGLNWYRNATGEGLLYMNHLQWGSDDYWLRLTDQQLGGTLSRFSPVELNQKYDILLQNIGVL